MQSSGQSLMVMGPSSLVRFMIRSLSALRVVSWAVGCRASASMFLINRFLRTLEALDVPSLWDFAEVVW
jgi:hypothetical protein